MPRKCAVSGKTYNAAKDVSFSNKHHRRKQYANLQYKRFWDPEKKIWVRLRVTVKVMKTITKYGLRSALKRYNASPNLLRK